LTYIEVHGILSDSFPINKNKIVYCVPYRMCENVNEVLQIPINLSFSIEFELYILTLLKILT